MCCSFNCNTGCSNNCGNNNCGCSNSCNCSNSFGCVNRRNNYENCIDLLPSRWSYGSGCTGSRISYGRNCN